MYFSYVPLTIFSFFNRPLFLNLLFKQILVQYYSILFGKVVDVDDGARKDDATGQPKGSDAGLLSAGISDAVSTQKEAKTAAPGRRQKASSGDKGAQKAKKARVAPKGK